MASSPSPQGGGALIAGRYRIERKLGSGSLGSVYLAIDELQRTRIALKVIRADRLTPRAAAGLGAEFQTFVALRHPQIARALDFGQLDDGGASYYTREYVSGVPLPAGPPGDASPREFLRPVLDVLDALDYMHTAGVLHLDVHAGNLIVADDSRRGAVLIDFGLVRSFEELAGEVSSSLGGVLSREFLSSKTLGPSADLYMAGRLILYRLTGRASGEAKLPSEIPGWGPRLTLDLERIATKALDPSPRHRFSSARELRDALARAIGRGVRPRAVGAPAERTVGRAAELAGIDAALSRLLAGASSVVLFTGPEGIGKSRLLAETGLRARLRGLEVIETKFSPGPELGLAQSLQAARSRARGRQEWLEALSAEHGGSPAERARKAAAAFFAEEGTPLVLLLDDADLAERESRDLASALAEEALAATREGRALRHLCLVAGCSKLPFVARRGMELRRLQPLSAREAARLLEELLRPLSVAPQLLARAASAVGRSPLRLRQAAVALRDAWGSAGQVPGTATLPDLPAAGPATSLPAWIAQDTAARAVLGTLAAAGRACRADEAAAGAELPIEDARAALRRLEAAEVVTPIRAGRVRRHALRAPGPPGRAAIDAGTDRAARRVHARIARHLAARSRSAPLDALEEAHLAAHLIHAGNQRQGRRCALRAAAGLNSNGLHGHAAHLLKLVLESERSLIRRLEVAEALSGVLEEAGDHAEGIALLAPFRAALSRLPAKRRVRFWRLLGMHYHRGGFPEKAREAFATLAREADPNRDVEDLVFADSEVAELCTYRGLYGQAEEACLRGLARLESLEGEFRRTMEIVLRASLGHLKLRRMALTEAREDLRAARKLARGCARTALEAVILNNLGIAERQLNCFGAAKAAFHEAERLLTRGGEGKSLVKIACNLAVIAAQEGDRETASAQTGRAARLIRRYPGDRLEFFVSYTRGVVAQLLGDPAESAEALSRALPAGKRLGDRHLVDFGEVLLAEANLACGRYAKALAGLRRAARMNAPPLLCRMAHARLLLVAHLLGARRAAAGAARQLQSVPRADGALPEAWNDVFIAAACCVAGEPAAHLAQTARSFFTGVGVPAGARFARAILLAEAIRNKDDSTAVRLAADVERELDVGRHGVLRVLEPLLVAEARFSTGELESAERLLTIASGAIVGAPCLELDWRIELLRARVALRRGDRSSARRCVQRSLHVRGLLIELVPASARKALLAHPRFAALDETAERVERSPCLVRTTARLESLEAFQGMVGRSTAMARVFGLIDRLRDHELPVLIRGETGTGKELAARALHATSSRAKGPFLALHSAALPEELFEAELFGHEGGAFTGADNARPGLLEGLSGGTLLLDDVEHLTPASQAKLLQVLGSGRARRLGGLAPYTVDVRVLASTAADLPKLVEHGAFRADLYFRLKAVEIALPPLRERRGDVAALALHFVELHAARLERPRPEVDRSALEALEAHDWPGNVRELESLLLRALVELSAGEALRAENLHSVLPCRRTTSCELAPTVPDELMAGRSFEDWRREAERAYVLRLFRESRGNLPKIMAALGVRRTQLYALFRRLGIQPRSLRGHD